MTSTEARAVLTAAVSHRTAAVATAEALTGRKATAAWRAVETANDAVALASRDVEMAVRAEEPDAEEATVQVTARTAEASAGAYTHLATVGAWANVPVRREGRFWWSKHQVHLAVVHSPRNVRDLRPLPAGQALPALARDGRHRYEV